MVERCRIHPGLTAKRFLGRRRLSIRCRNRTYRTRQTTFPKGLCRATVMKGPCVLVTTSESAKTRARQETYTHVHERAIAYAVGDDTNSPICDSSSLGLLLLLSDWLNYPRLRITLGGRCGHAAQFSAVAGSWRPGCPRITDCRPEKFASGACQLGISPVVSNPSKI